MLHISNVQHFSTGDGAGIRTTVFFQGCNLHCPWCHNPENLHVGVVTLRYHAPDRVEQMGRSVTAEQLLPELLEDADFYKPDGGVTFSGGEVLLQAAEAAELARLLHQNGISVLVDTAGCLRYDAFAALNPYVSGYLFDFKTADAARYRAIGGDLSLIKQNLVRLLREGIGVRIRIPLIPDFNVDAESARNRCNAGGSVALSPFGERQISGAGYTLSVSGYAAFVGTAARCDTKAICPLLYHQD